jgi:hypothetical protein
MSQNPDHPKRKRATQAEMQDRIDEVFILLRQGYNHHQIKKVLIEKGLHEKTAQRAIRAAWDNLSLISQRPYAEQLGLLLTRLNHIFCQVSSGPEKNLDLAIKIVALQNKIIQCPKNGPAHGPTQPGSQEAAIEAQLSEILQQLDRDPTD